MAAKGVGGIVVKRLTCLASLLIILLISTVLSVYAQSTVYSPLTTDGSMFVSSGTKAFYCNGNYWVTWAGTVTIDYAVSSDLENWSTGSFNVSLHSTPGNGREYDIAVDTANNCIHFAYFYSGGGGIYRRADIHANGTYTWSAPATQVLNFSPCKERPSIAVDSYGLPWIAGSKNCQEVRVRASSTANGTWTNDASKEHDFSSVYYCIPQMVALTGGKMAIVNAKYSSGPESGLAIVRWTGSAWGAWKDFSSQIPSPPVDSPESWGVTAQDDDIHMAWNGNTTTGDIYYAKYLYATNSITYPVVISPSIKGLTGGGAGYQGIEVVLDSSNDLWVFFAEDSGDRVVYEYFDGSSWTYDTVLIDETVIDGITDANARLTASVDAVAATDVGVFYVCGGASRVLKFISVWTEPEVTTSTAQLTDCEEVYLRGNIVNIGYSYCAERGFDIDYDSDHSSYDATWSEAGVFGTGAYYQQFTTDAETTYYYRAYMIDAYSQTDQGSWIQFTTPSCDVEGQEYTPLGGVSVTTKDAESIDLTTATLRGDITDTGDYTCTERGFEWGESISYGDTWSETGTFAVEEYTHGITGLQGGTTYHFRATAYSTAGWSYGADETFTTGSEPPTITTNAATYLSLTSARLNAYLDSDGGINTSIRFQYGLVGNVTDNNTGLVSGYNTGNSAFVDISSLSADTTYQFRAVATNAAGTYYGGNLTFTTTSEIGDWAVYSCNCIPRSDGPIIDISWVPVEGASESMVRASTGSYPSTTSDGSLVGITEDSSIAYENLTPGQMYYFSVWGKSGGNYTNTSANCAVVCSMISAEEELDSLTQPGNWFLTADYTRMSGAFFYDVVINAADAIGFSYVFAWFLFAIYWAAVAFIITYWPTRDLKWSTIATVVVIAVFTGTGCIAGWVAFIFALAALGIGNTFKRPSYS